jgi:hypothetical protein
MTLQWPAQMLGPAPSLKQTATLCWCVAFVLLAVPLGVAAFDQDQATFDADFANFYILGKILNEYPHDQLYDYNLQRSMAEQVHPLTEGEYGPLTYPPAVAIAFQPFAKLPYRAAYKIWLLITMTVYVWAVVTLGQSLFPERGALRSLLLCFSLAFFPFVIETLMNGQLSAIGFFALSMAIRDDRRQRPLACGIWLAVCLYKPTLLIWVLPMLLVTRRWKALAGFFAGAAVFLFLTTAIAGVQAWHGYLSLLRYFGSSTEIRSALRLSKYVDITAFTRLLTKCAPRAALAVFFVAALPLAAVLGRRWSQNRNHELVWATAISATLVVNVYTPIYDATLVVIGIMLTISGLWRNATPNNRSWLLILVFAIFIAPWECAAIAVATRVQVMTLLFTALGIMQYRGLGRFDSKSGASLVAK